MKSLAFCAAVVATCALCLPAWSAPPAAKWSQPVDTTRPVGQISQTCPVTVPTPGIQDIRSADAWESLAESPSTTSSVTVINWWGDYHKYEENNAGPVNPPTVLPTSFVLREYANDATDPANTKPGALITEVEIPLSMSTTASCNQSYVRSVKVADGPPAEYIHIFGYKATLSWDQTYNSIYWLSIQAKFATAPQELVPAPYMNWEWLNTPPADFLGSGMLSSDGGATWTKAEYAPAPDPYAGKAYNFAFELNPLEIVATPAGFAPKTPTLLKIVANIPPITRDFRVFIVVTLPNRRIMSFVPMSQARSGKGAQDMNILCLPVKGLKALAQGTAETIPQGANVTIFNSNVSLAAGTYLLKIGLFDPQQPMKSENDAFLLSSTQVVVQ
jgi:hypothetical protein